MRVACRTLQIFQSDPNYCFYKIFYDRLRMKQPSLHPKVTRFVRHLPLSVPNPVNHSLDTFSPRTPKNPTQSTPYPEPRNWVEGAGELSIVPLPLSIGCHPPKPRIGLFGQGELSAVPLPLPKQTNSGLKSQRSRADLKQDSN